MAIYQLLIDFSAKQVVDLLEYSVKEGFMIECILKDLMEPISYIPIGALFGASVVVFLLSFDTLRRYEKGAKIRRYLRIFFLFTYVGVVLMQAFFSREPGSREGIDLTLFGIWGEDSQSHAYVIENILFFMPLGILLPLNFTALNNIFKCTITGLILSIILETFQLITGRGYCQLNDVMMNTLGTFVGVVSYFAIILTFHPIYITREIYYNDSY